MNVDICCPGHCFPIGNHIPVSGVLLFWLPSWQPAEQEFFTYSPGISLDSCTQMIRVRNYVPRLLCPTRLYTQTDMDFNCPWTYTRATNHSTPSISRSIFTRWYSKHCSNMFSNRIDSGDNISCSSWATVPRIFCCAWTYSSSFYIPATTFFLTPGLVARCTECDSTGLMALMRKTLDDPSYGATLAKDTSTAGNSNAISSTANKPGRASLPPHPTELNPQARGGGIAFRTASLQPHVRWAACLVK